MTWLATIPLSFHQRPAEIPGLHTYTEKTSRNKPQRSGYVLGLPFIDSGIHSPGYYPFSDRGTPKTFRHMNGYSSHTFKWYNDKGEYFWVQYHFKTEQGIQNLTREEAEIMKGKDP